MQKLDPEYSLDRVFRPERDLAYVHFENAAAHPFQPDPIGFPRVNAWWLADCALLAYWDESDAMAIFNRAELQSTFISAGSTDCYVAQGDAFVIVAFRGTEPDQWADVLTDAKVRLVSVPWATGKVHRGFSEAIEAIWSKLETELGTKAGDRTVWFCGHSLGAALAVLAADRYSKTRGVCTIGCPRVGNAAFATAFNSKLGANSLRYVNRHDIVTHVPLPASGYRHVEQKRSIAADGTITGQPTELAHYFAELFGPPEVLLEHINGLVSGTLTIPQNALLDHMPKAYAIWTWNDYDRHG